MAGKLSLYAKELWR